MTPPAVVTMLKRAGLVVAIVAHRSLVEEKADAAIVPSARSNAVQLLTKLTRSVRTAGSGIDARRVSWIRRLPNMSPFCWYDNSAGSAAAPGMVWNAVSKSSVIVLPIELVKPPSAAMPNGTLATTRTGVPPVLSTMPTVTRGTNSTPYTSTTVAIHFQPCSFSGANMYATSAATKPQNATAAMALR